MQCSRLLYPFAWLPRRAKHHGHKVTRLSDFENRAEERSRPAGFSATDAIAAPHCVVYGTEANKARASGYTLTGRNAIIFSKWLFFREFCYED